jgi:hypothetical protein
MPKILDLMRKRFGKLVVIDRGKRRTPNGAMYWLCKCDCGKEKEIPSRCLVTGDSKSCGCAYKLPDGESMFRVYLGRIKRNAKIRNLSFLLSDEEVRSLSKQNCHYCGLEPKQKAHQKYSNGDYIYNGIDRINNSKGYEIENVVPCCVTCNYAKKGMSYDEFILWIDRVHNNLSKVFGKRMSVISFLKENK